MIENGVATVAAPELPAPIGTSNALNPVSSPMAKETQIARLITSPVCKAAVLAVRYLLPMYRRISCA